MTPLVSDPTHREPWFVGLGRVAFRVRMRWAAKRIEAALHVLIRHHKGENVLSLRFAGVCLAQANGAIATLRAEAEDSQEGPG